MTAAHLAEGALLFSPLFLGFLAHGLSMRFGWGRRLARPIDAGRTWRGRRLLGDNKTYRGVVAVALGTALGFAALGRIPGAVPPLSRAGAALLGLAVGAAAMVAELPNSALKRQLAIAPGAQATGWRGALFHVLDQVDVLVGGWLVLGWVVPLTAGRALGSFIFIYVGHQLASLAGYALGLRRTVR
jgi:CDP-2,3-bis-(O-geranylgeranyl)-sn-glycerol synthase